MTERLTAYVTAPFRGAGLDRLESVCDVVLEPWLDQTPIRLFNPEQITERVAELGARVLICEADSCRGPLLDLPLVVIGSTRGDPTNVDTVGATAAGIPVLRTPGRNADAVAEMTIALLFAVNRHVVAGDRDMRNRSVYGATMPSQRYKAWELAGRTAGVIGLGAVGRATAWRLTGLGMNVISHDPYASDATHSLADLLAEADVVSMHAAVTPETFGMIGPEQFAAMKPGSIYLNSARAGLHSTEALVDALKRGHLAGAGLDHVDGEVLPEGHPLIDLANVVLTPHIGGATFDTDERHSAMIADDVIRILRGDRPERLANPEVWDTPNRRRV